MTMLSMLGETLSRSRDCVRWHGPHVLKAPRGSEWKNGGGGGDCHTQRIQFFRQRRWAHLHAPPAPRWCASAPLAQHARAARPRSTSASASCTSPSTLPRRPPPPAWTLSSSASARWPRGRAASRSQRRRRPALAPCARARRSLGTWLGSNTVVFGPGQGWRQLKLAGGGAWEVSPARPDLHSRASGHRRDKFPGVKNCACSGNSTTSARKSEFDSTSVHLGDDCQFMRGFGQFWAKLFKFGSTSAIPRRICRFRGGLEQFRQKFASCWLEFGQFGAMLGRCWLDVCQVPAKYRNAGSLFWHIFGKVGTFWLDFGQLHARVVPDHNLSFPPRLES